MRVLIVDDHVDSAEMIAQLVESWGYEGTYASSGADGLAKARAVTPDVILLDWSLGDIDAVGFLAKLAKVKALATTSIVLITGRTEVDVPERVAALALKPVDFATLEAMLAAFAARSPDLATLRHRCPRCYAAPLVWCREPRQAPRSLHEERA